MNQLFGNEIYIQNSVSTSRNFQEELSVIQNNTAYGALAALIGTNMQTIDRFAEYIGNRLAENMTDTLYEAQYGNGKISGRINRFFTSNQVAYENQVDRRNSAFLTGLVAEGGIKVGARMLQNWANEKEKYCVFQQVYTILGAFTREHDFSANVKKANMELNKIRNSFPLTKNDKDRLKEIDFSNIDLFNTDIPLLAQDGNDKIIEDIAFLLYSIFAQKFGDDIEKESILRDYYSFLGWHGRFAAEMIRENKNNYDQIARDQVRYLKIARGMVNNFEAAVPQIDIRSLANRATAMAELDPYCMRRNRVSANAGVKKKISDLFFEAPEVVMHAGAIATAQFDLDDDGKEGVRKKLVNWGIDGVASDSIIKQATEIKNQSEQ